MATIELNATNFSDTITGNDFVIVDFWAPWCGPCRSFAPVYEELSEQHPDIVFAKVNTEQEQELAGHFQIRSIPTLMLFREQVILYSEAGALPKQAMLQLISDAQAVDMQEVHKSLQEQNSQA
jgi:thioredoxin 1